MLDDEVYSEKKGFKVMERRIQVSAVLGYSMNNIGDKFKFSMVKIIDRLKVKNEEIPT